MFKFQNHDTEFNFWPSIADTLLAIFMVFLMIWLAEKLIFLQELNHVKIGNSALTQQFEKLNKECTRSKEYLKESEETRDQAKLKAQNALLGWQRCEGEKQTGENEKEQLSFDLKNCEQQVETLQQYRINTVQYLRDKPPIIKLSELEEEFSFSTGDAKLSQKFKEELLNNTIPKLVEIKNKYGVDVLEVIGHTDGEAIQRNKNSNLDTELENAVRYRNISNLRYGSNADLGLMRALAVAFFLQERPELSEVQFRVYSAAQLILTNGKLADDALDRFPDKARRRIELRFTHLETSIN
jgi:flagellar motor protein MotB